MAIVTLVSGGLDSMLMAVLTAENGLEQHPLFVDYGQVFYQREYAACVSGFKRLGLPKPKKMSIPGFGRLIPCGLTNRTKRVVEDAFLPNRNLLFLVCGAAYAHSVEANGVAIGFLNEKTHLFPDQTRLFLESTQATIEVALGYRVNLAAPLMSLNKAEVVALARTKGITKWYSCHRGTRRPCGRCISCREYRFGK